MVVRSLLIILLMILLPHITFSEIQFLEKHIINNGTSGYIYIYCIITQKKKQNSQHVMTH